MNTLNFDPSNVDNYPLSIDRMAELQHNLGAAADILTNIQPHGDCILAGCESAGAAGYVRLNAANNDGGISLITPQYEIFEVEADTSGLSNPGWLVLEETTTTVNNSEGTSVVVSSKRVLKWATADPGSGLRRSWSTLRRAKLGILQNTAWQACRYGSSNGCNDLGDYNGNITPTYPKARIKDGFLELEGFFGISQYGNYDKDKPLFFLPNDLVPSINHDLIVPLTRVSTSDYTSPVGGYWAVICSGLIVASCRLDYTTTQPPILSLKASIPL